MDPGDGDRFGRTERRRARAARRGEVAGADHAIVFAYDGRAFAGYARQPGVSTVEGALRSSLEPIAPGFRRMAVAGRTDRGVSASAQVVSFRADRAVPPAEIGDAVDRAAPGSITCLSAEPAPRGFHAQFWATERRYLYLWTKQEDLSLAPEIDRLLRPLVGRRCFNAYARETVEGASTVRTLRSARCRRTSVGEQAALAFEFSADGFLRRMVRVLVATALDAARRGEGERTLVELAAAGDRSRTARPAPSEGLRLSGVVHAPWGPSSAGR